MRALKFRAYDGKVYTYFDIYDVPNSNTLDGCAVEQFTGLLDKQGKEIYEGDIVLVPIGYPEDGKPIYGNFQGVIVYGSPIYFTTDEYGLPIGTTGFFIETKDGRHSMLLGRDEKVIGNIYENKELLESE